MANDPRDASGARLQAALFELGRDPERRAKLIELLTSMEASFDRSVPARDTVTGPIVDALHSDDDIYTRTLADGTVFTFLFRTKIARDFMMSSTPASTHVWEPQTTKLILRLCERQRKDVIVGGAYFGDQAILLAKAAAKFGGKVHGFEPNAAQFAMLTENARLNGLTNLLPLPAGLWSEDNVTLKLDGFDSFANAVVSDAGQDDTFPTVAIDTYMRQQGRHVGLIHLDIEGAELRALQGADATIAADRPDIVFEVHRDYVDWTNGMRETDICRFLTGHGYTIYAVRDFNTFYELPDHPVELVPMDDIYLEGPPHGFNMVALADRETISDPLFQVVRGVSPKLLAHKAPELHHPLAGL